MRRFYETNIVVDIGNSGGNPGQAVLGPRLLLFDILISAEPEILLVGWHRLDAVPWFWDDSATSVCRASFSLQQFNWLPCDCSLLLTGIVAGKYI
jgi:hypothetical protein